MLNGGVDHGLFSGIALAGANTAKAEELDDGLLTGWSTRGDRTLVLQVGAGYEGFDHFELRNPFRLVVDLKGDRTARPPRLPAEVPTPTPAPAPVPPPRMITECQGRLSCRLP